MALRILLLGGKAGKQKALAQKILSHFPDARVHFQPEATDSSHRPPWGRYDVILAGDGIRWSQLKTLLGALKQTENTTPVVVFSDMPAAPLLSKRAAGSKHKENRSKVLGRIITNLLEEGSEAPSDTSTVSSRRWEFLVERHGVLRGRQEPLPDWLPLKQPVGEPVRFETMFPGLSLEQVQQALSFDPENPLNRAYRFVVTGRQGSAFLVSLFPAVSDWGGTDEILLMGEVEELDCLPTTDLPEVEQPSGEQKALCPPEWETVLGALEVGIAVLKDERHVQWANPAWWNLLKLPEPQDTGHDLLEALLQATGWHRETLAGFREALEHLLYATVDPPVLEARLIEQDSQVEHWFRIQKLTGPEERTVLFLQKITREKNIHKDLEILVHALRSTTECISITDLDNHIIFVNDAFTRVYGYRREELLGQSIERLRPKGFSEDLDREILELTLQGGWEGEVLNCRKDGSVFPVHLSTSAVRDADGKIVALIGVARDISERKAQEAALRESQSQLRSLLDKAPEAIILYEVETNRLKDANPRAFELFGYSPDAFFQCSLLDLCPEYQPNGRLSSELIEEYIARARQGEDPSFEWVHLRADNKPIWCEIHLTYFVANKREYVRGTILDISERKRIEDQLRQSEAKFRSFFENSLDVVFTTDARGNIVDINEAVQKVLGYRPEELRGKPALELTTDPRAAQGMVEALLQNGYVRAREVYGRSRDGSVKIGLLSATLLRNECGTITGVQGIVQDITERKAQEEEIYRLATVVQQSKEGVLITDEKGFAMYANPAFRQITGLSDRSVLGLPFRRVFTGVSPDRLKRVWELLKNGKYWQGNLVQKRGGGSTRHLFLSAFPVEDSYGRVINFAFTIWDLTKEKQLEHQLHRVQRLEAIGHMAGSIAHDFNNLLSLILGYAELIQCTYGHVPGLAKDVERIIEATENGARLTSQLLAFGRRQIIQPKLLNLNDFISGLQSMLRHLVEDTISLEFQLLPDLPPVVADEGQIQQILLNLIINARDAILSRPREEKPARIVVRTSACDILASDSRFPIRLKPGTYIRLEVEDTGTGIPPNVMEHIFEPFFTTKGKGKGTGLGLSSVFGILKQNQAGIEVHTTPGCGTTFVVLWPAHEKRSMEKSPAKKKTRRKRATRTRSQTILYVEDDAHIRQLIAEGLQRAGYRVLVASDGLEALDRFGEETIDVLFTDVLMPRMDGRTLAERLKARNPGLAILFASGYVPAAFQEGEEFRLIQKPFSVKDVLQQLDEML